MRSVTPHSGVEPCVGPKTIVMGFPRIVEECLLALAEHTSGWTAAEGVNVDVFTLLRYLFLNVCIEIVNLSES